MPLPVSAIVPASESGSGILSGRKLEGAGVGERETERRMYGYVCACLRACVCVGASVRICVCVIDCVLHVCIL